MSSSILSYVSDLNSTCSFHVFDRILIRLVNFFEMPGLVLGLSVSGNTTFQLTLKDGPLEFSIPGDKGYMIV